MPEIAARPDAPPALSLEPRHYRVPRATAWYLRGHTALVMLIGLLAVVANEGGTSGLVGGFLCIFVVVGIWLWGEHRLPLAGVYETAQGLRAVKLVGSTFAPWHRVEAVESSSKPPRSRVMVVGANGLRVRLIGTAQGARIAWDTGETRDIVAVLNERIALWKAADDRSASQSY